MAWFRRSKANIDRTTIKKDIPGGLWVKCDGCNEIIHRNQLVESLYTCPKCSYHFRIGSKEYIQILLDDGSFKELDGKMQSVDPLKFVDSRRYSDRLKEVASKTGLTDAIRTGVGTIESKPVVFGAMDFSFIGGSMGSVVGEKVARAADKSLKTKRPLILISASGGARMMEGALSLMQLAKSSAKLSQLAVERIPYISILTDPTTGGASASFSMLGDVNIAEPNALIGFAGPRVIRQTIGRDLPQGFQRSEFLLDHGFVDLIIHRRDMKSTLAKLLTFLQMPA